MLRCYGCSAGSYSVSDAWTVEDLVESYHQQFSEPSFRSKI